MPNSTDWWDYAQRDPHGRLQGGDWWNSVPRNSLGHFMPRGQRMPVRPPSSPHSTTLLPSPTAPAPPSPPPDWWTTVPDTAATVAPPQTGGQPRDTRGRFKKRGAPNDNDRSTQPLPDDKPKPPKWWTDITDAMAQPFDKFTGKAAGTVAAVMMTARNVTASRDAGGQAVQNIIDGANKAVGGAMEAGQKIGNTLLEAALTPFGKSGTAATSLANTLGNTIQSAVHGVINGVGGFIKGGGKLVGAGAAIATGTAGGVLGGFIGAGIGGVGAVPGIAIGAMVGSAIGLVAMKLVTTITGAIGGALGAIGEVFGKLGDMAAAGLKTVFDVLSDITQVTQQFSLAVMSVRNATGMTLNQSFGVAQRFGAFGIGPQALSGMMQGPGMSPMMFGMRAKMFGVSNYTDENFIANLAGNYQKDAKSGPFGKMMADAKLKALFNGNVSPEMLATVNLPVDKIREQQKWTTDLYANMGLHSSTIKNFAQDWTMLMNRVQTFADVVRMRLAQELFPMLQSGLERATAWMSANAGKIADYIKSGVEWLYVEFPALLMNGMKSVLLVARWFVGSFESVSRWIGQNAEQLLMAFDSILNGLRQLVAFAAGVGAALIQFNKMPGMGSGQGRNRGTNVLGLGTGMPNGIGIGNIFQGASAATAFMGARNNVLSLLPESNLAAKYTGTLQRGALGAADAAHNIGDWLDQRLAGLEKTIASYDKDERRAAVRLLTDIKQSVEKVADNTGQTANHTRNFGVEKWLALMGSVLAHQAYTEATR